MDSDAERCLVVDMLGGRQAGLHPVCCGTCRNSNTGDDWTGCVELQCKRRVAEQFNF